MPWCWWVGRPASFWCTNQWLNNFFRRGENASRRIAWRGLCHLMYLIPLKHFRCHAFLQWLSLALVCRDQSEKVNAFVMLITAGVSLALNHIAIGLVVGLIISLGINKRFSFE